MGSAAGLFAALSVVSLVLLFGVESQCKCDTSANWQILMEFYNSGGNYCAGEWTESITVCELKEITCNGSDITSLIIEDHGESDTTPYGTIPPSLGNLTNLTQLFLEGCRLSGAIPDSFKNLVNLRTLSLTNNAFGGSFPSVFREMPQLTNFSLALNQFNGTIPDVLFDMPHLTYLSLASNQFNGTIPSSISSMRSLWSLDLSGNKFVGPIPSEVSELPTLYSLNLGSNYDLQLNNDTMPQSFGNLRQLRTLTLSYTNFTDGTFPPALCSLVNLTSLDVSSSQLRGSIPQCLSSFANIESLNIGSNAFNATIPSFVYTLTRLTTLQCSDCGLRGGLEIASLSSLSNLQQLSLESNYLLGGTIDSSLCRLTSLVALILFECALTGTIPDCIDHLSALAHIDLSNNMLSGTLPAAIGKCSLLIYLYVGKNMLHGAIPTELNQLTDLSVCDLSNNMFSGVFASLKIKSFRVDLSNNRLTGSLPKALPPQIVLLSLSGNNISGGLPQSWYKSSLEALDVSNNRLSGVLPPVWCVTSNWRNMQLSSNHFVGILPPSWAAVNNLQSMELQSNSLSGPLPPQWGVHLKDITVDLTNNAELCGGVPSSWANILFSFNGSARIDASCHATRFIATPLPLMNRVTLQYCSIACDSAAPGYFPATPQTDEEIDAMTAVVVNASHVAQYFLLGGGMIPSDPTTLRWLSGPLGDTDDGEGTIFYVEDVALPSGRCVMPCRLNISDEITLGNGSTLLSLFVNSSNGNWVTIDADAALQEGTVGCICQSALAGTLTHSVRLFTPWATSSQRQHCTSTLSPLRKDHNHQSAGSSRLRSRSIQSPSGSLSFSPRPKLPTPSPSDTTLLTSPAVLLSFSDHVVVSMSRTLPGPELLVSVPTIQKAAEVVSSAAAIFSAPLSVVGGSAGAADGALLAVVLQVSCGTDSSRGIASIAWLRYLLSPFVDLGHFWMVVGNVLVVAGAWGAAEIVSVALPRITPDRVPTRNSAHSLLRHPSLALRLSGFLSVGVLFGSGRLISTTSMTAVDAASSSGVSLPAGVLAAVGAVGVLLTASVHVYALFLVARTVLPTAVEVRWGDASVSTLMPSTEWKPDALVATHGSLFTAHRAPLSLPVMAALLLLPMTFAVVGASDFGGALCLAKLIVMIIVQIIALFIVGFRRPFIAPLATLIAALSGGTLVALLSVALIAAVKGDSKDLQTVRSVATVLNSLCSVLRVLYVIVIRLYRVVCHKNQQASDHPNLIDALGGVNAGDTTVEQVPLDSLLLLAAPPATNVSRLPVDTSHCCQRVRIHLPPQNESLKVIIAAICRQSSHH